TDGFSEHRAKRDKGPVPYLEETRRPKSPSSLLQDVQNAEALRHLDVRPAFGPEDASDLARAHGHVRFAEMLQHAVGMDNVKGRGIEGLISAVSDNEIGMDVQLLGNPLRGSDARQ